MGGLKLQDWTTLKSQGWTLHNDERSVWNVHRQRDTL